MVHGRSQCRWRGPQQPQPGWLGFIGQAAGAADDPVAATEDANTESFFSSFFEPQCGQAAVPFQFEDRTSVSKLFSHFWQTNSYSGMAIDSPG